jgi:hypothetical protein
MRRNPPDTSWIHMERQRMRWHIALSYAIAVVVVGIACVVLWAVTQ